jgi:hypothetical protein
MASLSCRLVQLLLGLGQILEDQVPISDLRQEAGGGSVQPRLDPMRLPPSIASEHHALVAEVSFRIVTAQLAARWG